MSFNFIDLDDFRDLMSEEIKFDLENNALYLSKGLSSRGRSLWQQLLTEAILRHDEVWLTEQIRNQDLLNPTESYQRNGETLLRNTRKNAPEILAEGEFNKFYARAVCRKAIDDGKRIRIYRARESNNPRPESEQKIGQIINPQSLLEDLRANKTAEPFFGVALINSGLSVTIADGD